jgi:hypothetical protein
VLPQTKSVNPMSARADNGHRGNASGALMAQNGVLHRRKSAWSPLYQMLHDAWMSAIVREPETDLKVLNRVYGLSIRSWCVNLSWGQVNFLLHFSIIPEMINDGSSPSENLYCDPMVRCFPVTLVSLICNPTRRNLTRSGGKVCGLSKY